MHYHRTEKRHSRPQGLSWTSGELCQSDASVCLRYTLIAESFDFTSIVRTDPRFQISQHLDYVFLPYSPVYGGVRGQGALYMEVLKYSTLLKRAGLRNSIFTEKLFGSEE